MLHAVQPSLKVYTVLHRVMADLAALLHHSWDLLLYHLSIRLHSCHLWLCTRVEACIGWTTRKVYYTGVSISKTCPRIGGLHGGPHAACNSCHAVLLDLIVSWCRQGVLCASCCMSGACIGAWQAGMGQWPRATMIAFQHSLSTW